MTWEQDPERRAINQHLWRMHDRAVRRGTEVLPKLVFHEELHRQEASMSPPHNHHDFSNPSQWELIDEDVDETAVEAEEGMAETVRQMDHQL